MFIKNKKDKGITLIALVVTIIVLLILAGISIQMLVGEGGILINARDASESTKDVNEDEQVKLAVAEALTNGTGALTTENVRKSLVKEFGESKVTEETFTGEEGGPWIFKGDRDSYIINENGRIGGEVDIDISQYVKIGDYIQYNPTFLDKDGKTKVLDEKLIYESVKRERIFSWKRF